MLLHPEMDVNRGLTAPAETVASPLGGHGLLDDTAHRAISKHALHAVKFHDAV